MNKNLRILAFAFARIKKQKGQRDMIYQNALHHTAQTSGVSQTRSLANARNFTANTNNTIKAKQRAINDNFSLKISSLSLSR